MKIITVTESRSMLNKYTVLSKNGNEGPVYHCTQHGEEAAAAEAMSIAISCEEYIIFANKKVLDCIPENLRRK